ncbi:MAG: hypothetical protein K8S62_05780 [Candidatus Sabulitectum sp.]|nr:hypothetical protein [Candidatus Sabulitectum sp.]
MDIDMSKIPQGGTPSKKPLYVPKEVMTQVYANLYHAWPDKQLPALDVKTPREAVKDKSARNKVINLLKMLESEHESHRDKIDFHPLWKELGLKRP